jgi:glucokinase
MARELKIGRVTIINDFVGIGYGTLITCIDRSHQQQPARRHNLYVIMLIGLLALESKDVVVLNHGTDVPDGPKACIGAGNSFATYRSSLPCTLVLHGMTWHGNMHMT